jgi:hypothetical protein
MMPLIPTRDFNIAKKRMKLGLHPAVIAAVEQATTQPTSHLLASKRAADPSRYGTLAQQTAGAFNRGEIPVSLGSGVNPGRARTVPPGVQDARARIDPLAGQRYDASLRRTAGGQLQEIHDYGDGRRMVFSRKPSAALTQRLQGALGPSAAQQLSNTATAHDKLLAMAVRQAAAGSLAHPPFRPRRFSRKPGPMQRY